LRSLIFQELNSTQGSLANAGMVIGGFVFFPLAHKFGRSSAIFWSLLGLMAAQAWSAGMTHKGDYASFLGSRVLSGFFGTVTGILGPRTKEAALSQPSTFSLTSALLRGLRWALSLRQTDLGPQHIGTLLPLLRSHSSCASFSCTRLLGIENRKRTTLIPLPSLSWPAESIHSSPGRKLHHVQASQTL